MIEVLIAEDSAVVAGYLKELLENDPDIHVVGTANDGAEAVRMAETLKPDVITMDICMPRINGVEATRMIMQKCPTRIIIITAGSDNIESRPAFDAIKAGALTLLEKPRGCGHRDYDCIKANLIKTVKLMSAVRVVARLNLDKKLISAGSAEVEPRIIAIGASTGGPAALSVILQSLPVGLPIPIVVAQHMTAGFGAAFVGWLNHESALPVKPAKQGERLEAGCVYLAPDNLHIGVTSHGRARLADSTSANSFNRPSVNYLFETVAQAYGAHSFGVLLTGMGEDGALGLRAIKDRAGKTICQNEETSAVFGMARAAIAMGAADNVLPLENIGPAIADSVGDSRRLNGEKIHA
jgi:two-component system chemotaxis response regulator CheB